MSMYGVNVWSVRSMYGINILECKVYVWCKCPGV